MSKILPCKTCKQQPCVQYYGRDNKIDIFCDSPDSVCYPGHHVTGVDHIEVIDEWNTLHGLKG